MALWKIEVDGGGGGQKTLTQEESGAQRTGEPMSRVDLIGGTGQVRKKGALALSCSSRWALQP